MMIAPLQAADYMKAARALFGNGETEDAMLYAEAALAENGECVECWLFVGDCRHLLGKKEEALAAYHRALKLAPGREDIAGLITGLERELEQDEKVEERVKLEARRRRSGWGAMAGLPSGVNFVRRLQDIYLASVFLGTYYDGQVALATDLFVRYPLERFPGWWVSGGLGWCTLAGGSETLGVTRTGKTVKASRDTRAGPHLPVAISFFHGQLEVFVEASAFVQIHPESELISGGGMGVRFYIEPR